MSNDTIRVGFVGAGNITTSQHIPGLQAIDGVEIVSVCNRSRESAQQVADKFDIPHVYDHWPELVKASDTHAIVIGAWPNLHCPVSLAALAADKHVLCEARLARNAQEAHKMLDAARAKPQLISQVVQTATILPTDRTVKRLIAEGYVGDVLAIEVNLNMARGFVDRETPFGWRYDADIVGLNVFPFGIACEVILGWVGAATRVIAMGKTFVKTREDPQSGLRRTIRVPDHLDVLAEMACGAQAHFGLSNVSGLAPEVALTLYGSEGTLRSTLEKLFGAHRSDTELHEITIAPAEKGGWRVEEEFVNAIRSREPIARTTFDIGVRYMEFTEAVARSMAEGRAIPLPLR